METPAILTQDGMWFAYLGFIVKAAYFVLGLWLYLRLMKYLKLCIQLTEKRLKE